MTKAKLHPALREFSGAMGEMVFRQRNGKLIVSMKPIHTAEPTEEQLAQRERFKDAVDYGKLVLSDPALLAYYAPLTVGRDISSYALAIGDYLRKPSVKSIDSSKYQGLVGDQITIAAKDDTGIVNVEVSIHGADGTPIESGNAVETGTGRWSYTATAPVAAGSQVLIDAKAFDRPGGYAVMSISTTVSGN